MKILNTEKNTKNVYVGGQGRWSKGGELEDVQFYKIERKIPEEKVFQEFVSLHDIKFPFIRFFCCIRWALCSLATG
jgi:hypothetical protein